MKIKNLALRVFIYSAILSLSVAYTTSAQVAVPLTEAEQAEYYEIVFGDTTRDDTVKTALDEEDKPGANSSRVTK